MDNKIFLSEVQWWLWWRCCPFTFCNTHSTVSAGGIFMPLMWSLSITFTFSSFIIFPFTSNIVFSLSFPNFLFVWCFMWSLKITFACGNFLLTIFTWTFQFHFLCSLGALNFFVFKVSFEHCHGDLNVKFYLSTNSKTAS